MSNMFIDLGYSVTMTEEQFQEEMAARREIWVTRITMMSVVRCAGRLCRI
ncbi:MAG: hypothetical protein Ct9H90mP25_0370 [Gammaproteobacteria bacterium]|nr:MAG: hypothetical protein Ct9H90mP25_0370 [Gammaproteobacteria bacterium]